MHWHITSHSHTGDMFHQVIYQSIILPPLLLHVTKSSKMFEGPSVIRTTCGLDLGKYID